MEGSRNSPDRQSSGGSPEERGSGGSGGRGAGEPVRSRWTPKPEQILILESIFNSGMVNPPKDETVRIRKLLERFGAVGDANVFYWFQNRRSRSRRRQRQMQAAAAAAATAAAASSAANSSPGASATVGLPSGALQYPLVMSGSGTACQYEQQASSSSSSGSTGGSSLGLFALGAGVPSTGGGFFQESCGASSPLATGLMMGDVDRSGGSDDLFAISRQMGFAAASPVASASVAPPSTTAHHQQYYSCQSPTGTITVFINGVPMEVPSGPIDMRAIFGQDVLLVHSTGALLPVDDYGILTQSLQTGESYFLVISHIDSLMYSLHSKLSWSYYASRY
ncbi:homeobox domain containing protein isoform X1 [Zea mays]|uniref:homeobox domain containing protein isoform X1 n=1 Tax=Zea mays TaxID=4577 RepID=UPI0009AAD6C4|nr:homeobox domain containing protein isoform X1 [Zea mays]|eukprot:XP_020399406.1 homeobox domain containing protein isoform X1 [Zea mays]